MRKYAYLKEPLKRNKKDYVWYATHAPADLALTENKSYGWSVGNMAQQVLKDLNGY